VEAANSASRVAKRQITGAFDFYSEGHLIMDYSKYEMMLVKRTNNVLRITLDRPEELNAINQKLHKELSTIFLDAGMDDDIDVISFTGAGRTFSAGGDWNWMREQIAQPAAFLDALVDSKRMIYSLLDCEKPVICRLNGDAIGLGCTLALFCDFVIAADTARLADPHARVGLVTGDGGAVIWSYLVGVARAKLYLLTGDFISAAEAADIGLIAQAVPADKLDETVEALVSRMANGATKAIGWSKAVINGPLRQAVAASLDASLAYEALSNATPDHKKAVEAFLAHRRPVFGSADRSGGPYGESFLPRR
jgi:enoyl-CoA hydratase